MGIFETFRLLLSPRNRLLKRLAATAADAENLAANLRRHAQMCTYPTIRDRLEELCESAATQANEMRELLLGNGVWPQLPSAPVHEGANNWERLRNDLTAAVAILRALRSQFAEWASIDPPLAERLRELASRADRQVERIRDLALKCDPQALD